MILNVNQIDQSIAPQWQDESLLWVLREHLGLNSPKFGCGVGSCGACSVLVDGQVTRSCVTPAASAVGKTVLSVEGLMAKGELHPVQTAWLANAVPQCGYCQCGQIIAAVALLKRVAAPNDAQIDEAMRGHLCRCGTQQRIRAAIHSAAAAMRIQSGSAK